jgi:hypothetical protein
LFACDAEELEGVPHYYVAATSDTDFAVLLDALDNAVSYTIECPSFDTISSILRVSTSLQFPKFREFAVHCLTSAWPSELENFSIETRWLNYAAETLSLARRYEIPSILKRALYELLRTPGFSKQIDKIAQSDLILLAKTREKLVLTWLCATIPEDASHHQPCVALTSTCIGLDRQYLTSKVISAYLHDPIHALQSLINEFRNFHADHICEQCIAAKIDILKNNRAKIWADLDDWLHLNN